VQSIGLLYIPNEYIFFSIEEREQIRTELGVDGILYRDEGIFFVTLFSMSTVHMTVLDHPSLEDYASIRSIADADLSVVAQTILHNSIVSEVPILST